MPSFFYVFAYLELTLQKGYIIETLPRQAKSWLLKFKIKPTACADEHWRNVIHVTQGGDYSVYGDRNPFISMIPRTNQINIASGMNGEIAMYLCEKFIPLHAYTAVSVTQKYSAKQKQYVAIAKLNDTVCNTEIVNNEPREFYNLRVYASDEWHEPAKVIIKEYSFENLEWIIKDTIARWNRYLNASQRWRK